MRRAFRLSTSAKWRNPRQRRPCPAPTPDDVVRSTKCKVTEPDASSMKQLCVMFSAPNPHASPLRAAAETNVSHSQLSGNTRRYENAMAAVSRHVPRCLRCGSYRCVERRGASGAECSSSYQLVFRGCMAGWSCWLFSSQLNSDSGVCVCVRVRVCVHVSVPGEGILGLPLKCEAEQTSIELQSSCSPNQNIGHV